MKLLFDQNISSKVLKTLLQYFSDSQHVNLTSLRVASDVDIFDFAKKNSYILVTLDSDFVDMNLLRGSPPKIIWLRTGNLTTNHIGNLLIEYIEIIKTFVDSDNSEILEIINL